MSALVGFLIIGIIVGLFPLIVGLKKKHTLLAILAVVVCGVAACVNILIAVGISVVAGVLLLIFG